MCIIPQLVFFHALQFPRIFFVTSLNMITDTLLVLGLAGGFRGGPVGGLCMVCTYCRCFSVFEPCLLLYYVVFLCVTIMNFCGGHARMGIVPDCDCDIYNMDMHVHNICMYNYVYIWVCNVIYIYILKPLCHSIGLFFSHIILHPPQHPRSLARRRGHGGRASFGGRLWWRCGPATKEAEGAKPTELTDMGDKIKRVRQTAMFHTFSGSQFQK